MNAIENQIEAYIRYPESLTEEEKREIRKQIDTDTEVAASYAWFAGFYRAYDDLRENRKPGKKPDSVIKLIPLEEDPGAERNRFVLAAQSSDSNGAAIDTVRTFASEEHRMLLRALHYKNKDEVRIHVLSEQIEKDDVILFDVPEESLLMVTSPGGKLSADTKDIQPEIVKNWKACTVHLPVCRVNGFGKKRPGSGYLAGKSVFSDEIIPIEMEVGDNKVEISPTLESSDTVCKHLVVYKNNQSTIIKMNNGMAVLPMEVLENDEIRLFFYN